MTLLSLLGRIMRYFLLRPETLFLLCISLALWSYFFHTDEVKTIVKSSRDAVKMVKGKVAEMMQNERFGGLDVLDAEFSKTWEFKSNNVAVYSIQGRRDHMEDRFDVLTDIVNKSHPSIFGVFDGHGGEVSVHRPGVSWWHPAHLTLSNTDTRVCVCLGTQGPHAELQGSSCVLDKMLSRVCVSVFCLKDCFKTALKNILL